MKEICLRDVVNLPASCNCSKCLKTKKQGAVEELEKVLKKYNEIEEIKFKRMNNSRISFDEIDENEMFRAWNKTFRIYIQKELQRLKELK